MKDPNNPCIFCKIIKKDIIFDNKYAIISFDSYPVSKFHSLIIPKRCVKSYFDLSEKGHLKFVVGTDKEHWEEKSLER